MTTTPPKAKLPIRDVLYALAMEDDKVNAGLLDAYVCRYPEYAQALTDLAIDLAVDRLRATPEIDASEATAVSSKVSPAVSRAMSRFQNRLYAVRQAASAAADTNACADVTPAANPFASLDRPGFRQVAQQLNANNVFVCKLRDRQIEPTTLTLGFLGCLAKLLKVSIDALRSHFDAATVVQTRLQLYKSDQKPEATARQTFEDAVRTSGLTEDQQRHLLSL